MLAEEHMIIQASRHLSETGPPPQATVPGRTCFLIDPALGQGSAQVVLVVLILVLIQQVGPNWDPTGRPQLGSQLGPYEAF